MSDKERLDEIKRIDLSALSLYLDKNTTFDGKALKNNWDWLIKQAEKAQQYKKMIDSLLKVKEAINLIFEVKENNIKEMMEKSE